MTNTTQEELLPRSDSNEAKDSIEKVFEERDWPVNPNAAARCGWEAARRYAYNRTPPAEQPAAEGMTDADMHRLFINAGGKFVDDQYYVIQPEDLYTFRLLIKAHPPANHGADQFRDATNMIEKATGSGELPALPPSLAYVKVWIDGAESLEGANSDYYSAEETQAYARQAIESAKSCGISWSGFNVWGSEDSIQRVKECIHADSIIPQLKDEIANARQAIAQCGDADKFVAALLGGTQIWPNDWEQGVAMAAYAVNRLREQAEKDGEFIKAAFEAHPNLDLDIASIAKEQGK